MMRQACLAPLAALFLCSCVRVELPEPRVVSGAAQEELAWRRAVDLALAKHPELGASRAELAASRHARNAALGAYLPEADGTMRRTQARTATRDTTETLAFDVDLSQPIFAGFGITGDAMQAWRTWNASYWAYRETSAEVRLALRSAYVELLRLTQLLGVNRRIAARRQENAEMIQLRYDAGREHQGSALRAQAIAEQAAFDVRQTERRIESHSLELGRQLGGTFWTPMTLAGELEQLMPAAPAVPGDYGALAAATPTVQRLTRVAEAQKAAIISAQADLWPTATGTYNYGYTGRRADELKHDHTIGLTVSVPLFRGGQTMSGVLESNADYRASFEAARSARDEQLATLAERWRTFRDAWELVEVRRRFLEAARTRAEVVRTQYTTGLADFQDFDTTEQELSDAEKAYVQSLADVLTEEARWRAAQGLTLEEDRDAG